MSVQPDKKTCGRCRDEKPRAAFACRSDRKDGLQWRCRACESDYQRAYAPRATARRHARRAATRSILCALREKGGA